MKEIISDRQGLALAILFMFGESSILVAGLTAQKDLWLAIILSILMALPLMFIYIGLFNSMPGKNLFDMIEFCFGKWIGKGIILLYAWYAFDLTSLVLRDFGQFVKTVSLHETPLIIPMIGLILLCTWAVKEGIEVLGRWGEVMFLIPIALTFVAVLLLIPTMNINHLRPTLYNGVRPVFEGAYEVFIYPFGELVIFTTLFSVLKNKRSAYITFILGLLIGGLLILTISVSIVLVLGVEPILGTYFPTYNTIAQVNIANALQRIEIVSAIIFLLGGFVKVSVYLIATCKGVVRVFGLKESRSIVVPISLLVINLTYFHFDNIMSFNEWIFDVWIYYAFLFMVIIPIMLLIIVKIKKKSLNKR